MEPLTPKLTVTSPLTSDAPGQSSQFLGVLYLALTGLIGSALLAAGSWAMAGKALSYLCSTPGILKDTKVLPYMDIGLYLSHLSLAVLIKAKCDALAIKVLSEE
ncbi:hypothetical protein DSO57_1006672 [Entomophthora muscae]|uniref:Uncharacterized protein n=2 Tax=Entomophthora muscae TaxID=34485 RepID=A0ACC2SWU5_9FUNG|nr:hypothetical protein DSO57_1022009 [Entomophthora muscae]KAJ9066747.1 hypothetical protein DSO57_1006672 [Entomophthora muscae]